jgi:hypothetical protein
VAAVASKIPVRCHFRCQLLFERAPQHFLCLVGGVLILVAEQMRVAFGPFARAMYDLRFLFDQEMEKFVAQIYNDLLDKPP